MEIRILFSLLLLTICILTCTKNTMAIRHCGNCGHAPVPYPLSTGPDCGDQSYKIRCSAGLLWFDTLNRSSYKIIFINPQSQRIIISPASLAQGACVPSNVNSQGIQLDDNLPFNITSSNTILLLNCSDAMLRLQAPINCSSSCICHKYIEDNAPACKGSSAAVLCCAFKTGGSQNEYVIGVHEGGCAAYQSFVNLDPGFRGKKWPDPGLELEWALPQEPMCNNIMDCSDLLNSKCLPDPQNAGQMRCFCNAGFRWDPINGFCQNVRCRGRHCKSRKKRTPLIGGVSIAVGGILLVASIGVLVSKQRQHVKKNAQKKLIKLRQEILNAKSSGKSARIFTGKELTKSTNNFSKDNLIGSGGFGDVFKGTFEDGTVMAIKRAKLGNTKGTDQVLNEVRILCQVNHRSLVRLFGCCVELEQPLMVYEYIPNGTLFDHLHSFQIGKWAPLTWLQRLRIAHQTAEGLAYLHLSAVPPIYHRDVKSSNILLNNNLDAKVSDFGLSRLVDRTESNQTHIFTGAQGTLGYLDPEYYLNFQLTDKSDVYSFGVVLLELLTSKKVIDFNREEEEVNLVVYMKKILGEERGVDAMDPMLKEGASKVELGTMKALGLLAAACLEDRRQNRPSMKEVTDEIEYIISIVTSEVSES